MARNPNARDGPIYDGQQFRRRGSKSQENMPHNNPDGCPLFAGPVHPRSPARPRIKTSLERSWRPAKRYITPNPASSQSGPEDAMCWVVALTPASLSSQSTVWHRWINPSKLRRAR